MYIIEEAFLHKLEGIAADQPGMLQGVETADLQGMSLDLAIHDYPEIDELLERVFTLVIKEAPAIANKRIAVLDIRLKQTSGPECGALAQRMGNILFACERFNEATEALAIALYYDPTNVNLLLKQGIAYLRLENWDEALRSLEKITQLELKETSAEEENTMYACWIGDMLIDLDVDLAQRFYKFAFELDDRFVPAIRGLGDCALKNREKGNSYFYYTMAESLDPDCLKVKLGLARWHYLEKNKQECLRHLEGCWKLKESDAATWIDIGNMYSEYRNPPQAMKAFRRALTIEPGNVEAITRLAELHHLTMTGPNSALN